MAVFDDGLTATYAQRKYCVQYRETDFDFVSRLMEEEGSTTISSTATPSTRSKLSTPIPYKTLENKATISYHAPGHGVHIDDEHIHALTMRQNVQPGAVAMPRYDFERPKADLGVKSRKLQQHERADYEIFD